ncbi:MAG: ATP-dependent Clp protease adaptor ClpS [Bdellovibrionota bacterium]
MGSNHKANADSGLDLDTEDEVSTEEPKLYKVLMHNDDYTPMDFVILVLKQFFNKLNDDAYKIMLDVHNKGVGLAGIYSFEVAESKVMQVNQFCKNNQHPLKTSFEEES